MAHPPLKSKYIVGPTDYKIQEQLRAERNEKSRLRMARKRAELRAATYEEQELAAERSRMYQATYREKNRRDLRIWAAQRRMALYAKRYGPVAAASYNEARRDRKKRQIAARKAKEAYHEADAADRARPTSDGARARASR